MKKFIAKILLLAAIVVAVDFLVGKTCELLICHAVGGDTKRMSLIADELQDSIIVFGSSRAIHHYDPQILQDSLGLSCYNAGRDGNGIIFNYGQFRLLKAHHTPQVLIYDVCLGFDLLEDDKTKYLNWLKRYYDRPGIDSIFWNVEKEMRVKMLSQMYRYNGSVVQLLSDCVHPMQEDVKGYRPLDGAMDYEPVVKTEEKKVYVYDSLKLHYWQLLIDDCRRSGVKLIFTLSPSYKATSQDVTAFQPLIDIAKKNGIPFISHYADTAYCTKRMYFKDTSHMNRQGATAFTKRIAAELKPLLIESVCESARW